MTAEQYKLQFDVSTRGSEQLEQVRKSVSNIDDQSKAAVGSLSQMERALVKIGEGAVLFIALERSIRGVTSALFEQSRALVENHGKFETLINSIRAYRLGSAALTGGFGVTAAGIGGGIIIEEALRSTNRFAGQVRSDAFTGASNGNGFSSVFANRTAGGILGSDLSGAGNINSLQSTVSKLQAIQDPTVRAANAFALLGNNAERAALALSLVNRSTDFAINTSKELAAELDGRALTALGKFKDAFDQLGNTTRDYIGVLRTFGAIAAQGFAIRVALVTTAAGSAISGAAGRSGLPSEGGGDVDRPFGIGDGGLSVPPLSSILGNAAAAGLGAPPSQPTAGLGRDFLQGRVNAIAAFMNAQGTEIERLQRRIAEAVKAQTDASTAGNLRVVQSEQSVLNSLRARINALAAAAEVSRLVGSLDDRGLGPLGSLFRSTQRTAEGIAQTSPLTGSQQAAISQSFGGAVNRLRGNLPLASADLSQSGFLYGFLPSVANGATVDQGYGSSVLANLNARRTTAIQQTGSFRESAASILAGPGQELSLVGQIRDIRIDTAQRVFSITRDIAQLEAAKNQADYEAQLRVLELLKQREGAIRTTGEQFTSALFGGRAGVSSFIRQQGVGIASRIGGNAAVELFGGRSPYLTLPGTSSNGQLTGLGRLLQGTPFGVDPLSGATNLNTLATQQNTAAIAGLTGIMGATGGGGGFVPGLVGVPNSVFGGAGSNPFIFSNNGGGAGNPGIASTDGGMVQVTPGPAPRSTAGAYIANAGALGIGALGVYSGVRQGGARGTLTAIGGGAGAAAGAIGLLETVGAIDPEPLSKAILMGIAAGAGIITSLLGDPKKKRASQIQSEIDAASFAGPSSNDFFVDTGGSGLDFDFRGNMRKTAPVIVQVQTMDAKSFMDNADKIGDAMRVAVNRGHRVNDAIQRMVLPQA